jgi:hypothetical protein
MQQQQERSNPSSSKPRSRENTGRNTASVGKEDESIQKTNQFQQFKSRIKRSLSSAIYGFMANPNFPPGSMHNMQSAHYK